MGYIYVLPIGAIDQTILESLAAKIELKFNHQCSILKNIDVPSYAFNSKRNQYSSTEILKKIEDLVPNDALKIMGVTDVDLFIPVLTFVFGQAQLNGRASIISLHRLRQEYYGLPANNVLLIERAIKEAIHEIGHTFGMTHCLDHKCVMYFSNSVRNVDVKTDSFCYSCSKILSTKIGGLNER